MELTVTAVAAAVLAAMLVGLSLAVSFRRRATGVATGYGDDEELMVRIRAQGNFVEYVPLGLLLAGIAEAGGGTRAAAVLAGALVLGRVLHAVGMYRRALAPRAAGMLLTYLALLGGAGVLLARLA